MSEIHIYPWMVYLGLAFVRFVFLFVAIILSVSLIETALEKKKTDSYFNLLLCATTLLWLIIWMLP